MRFSRAGLSLTAVVCTLLLLLIPAGTIAQDLEPRTYSNLPIGQNFLVAAYAHSEGEIAPSPSVPIKNVELTVDGYAGAYARSIDMWGESGKRGVGCPLTATISGAGKRRRTVSTAMAGRKILGWV